MKQSESGSLIHFAKHKSSCSNPGKYTSSSIVEYINEDELKNWKFFGLLGLMCTRYNFYTGCVLLIYTFFSVILDLIYEALVVPVHVLSTMINRGSSKRN